MRLAVRLIGLISTILFGTCLALICFLPITVERSARDFIQKQIEHQIADELGMNKPGAEHSRLSSLATALVQRHRDEIDILREDLSIRLKPQVDRAIARMQDPNCECRERLRQWVALATESRVSTLARAEPQLQRIVEGKYGDIVRALLRDLQIFLGLNLLAFAILTITSLFKPSHVRQLFIPAMLLAVATIAASVVYLFGQDWFFTILYGDYVGWMYGVWVVVIFGLLFDVVLFKARATTFILALLSGAVGTAVAC